MFLAFLVFVFFSLSDFRHLDAAKGLLLLSCILFMFSIISLIARKRIKYKKLWILLSVLLTIFFSIAGLSHLRNNFFETYSDNYYYSKIIKEDKSMWPEMLEHMPSELPTENSQYILKRTFGISKIQLNVFVQQETLQNIREQAQENAIYVQKGFNLSKSKNLWATQFYDFENGTFDNLSDKFDLFVIYLPKEKLDVIEDWQNSYYNGGIAINGEKNLVIYWAVYP
jgi:hypothetical protein